ncbi:MAG TPA: cytochrome c family protein [Caulobacteraceae bacterium]|jgi:cytochrome c|nr:cytochrome c family protein [Caulobacteraceae bacterium]
MRRTVLTAVGIGGLLLLAACGKPSSGDQPSAPSEPASAPAAQAPMTDADKKAVLAALPAAYQSADIEDGQSKFALCKSCHTTAADGPDTVGPNLHGVFGRKAGTKAGFNYSDGLKATNITWNADEIDRWIADPRKVVPGTKMTYAGMSDAKSRTDLVAYLAVATATQTK